MKRGAISHGIWINDTPYSLHLFHFEETISNAESFG